MGEGKGGEEGGVGLGRRGRGGEWVLIKGGGKEGRGGVQDPI